MVDRCPCVLQRGTQLQFKTERKLRHAADIMERVITKTIQLVQHALIDRVLPIDLKQLLHHRCNTIHIIGVERNDTRAKNIGDITERSVLVALQLQFAFERLFRLNTCIDGRDDNSVLRQGLTQQSRYLCQHSLQYRFRFPVLIHDHLAMQIHQVIYDLVIYDLVIYSMTNRLMKPVIMNT